MRLARTVALLGVSLALPGVGLSLPAVGASAPKAALSVPSVGVSVPSVGVTVPSVGVTVPSVGVTVPSVGVTVPSVGVSVPSVGVSAGTPSVSVTTPTVTASTPTTTTPAPSESSSGNPGGSSSGTPSEAPVGATPPASDPPSGGGSGSGSGSSGSTGGGSGTAAHGSSTVAGSTDDGAGAGTGGGSNPNGPGGAGGRRRSGRTHGGGSGGAAAALTPAGALALASDASATGTHDAGASGSSASHTSNPLDAIGKHIPLPIPVPDWSKPIILALALLALWLWVRSRVAVRRARRLQRRQATLLQDVDAMQAALVPTIPARVGGLAVSVAYRPAEGPAAGGDFYDVFVPERGKVAIILGDVAGHGHRALTQAALARYTLRAYLQTGLEPRAAIALAGRVLADPKAEHFATVVVGVYDTRDGCLTYAGAGHPPPIFHGLQSREPLAVCASPPVGWTIPTGRRQTTVSLPHGAVVCFYSDGLIEARCKHDLLGRERLSDILGELGSSPSAAKLLERVTGEADATPDDMAACILVPEMALVAGATHVEELEVDAEALAIGQARRFLQTCELPFEDVEQALGRAGDVAAAFGGALLRVELAGAGAAPAVEVSAPSSAAQTVATA
jgi:Stage II sporulation protein E (SpoIIE)